MNNVHLSEQDTAVIRLSLNGTRKVITEISDSKLEKAINTFCKAKGFKVDYSYQAAEEMSNDSEKSFDVDPATEEQIESVSGDLEEGNYNFRTGDILNWMCAENLLEAGEYIVTLCY